jgi:microcystin degradation protein MlrC
MKRILIAGMHHESNSFNPITCSEKDFRVIYGEDIYQNLSKNDSVSGIIETLREEGYELIPTVFARAVPNGEVDYDFYHKVKAEIIARAIAAQKEAPIDAITLSLHGSMRIKKLGDAEGYLLKELRNLFPKIPIFSALDMHATMTRSMHNNCDGFVGYKCAPHTDCFETGVHAAEMTIAALENSREVKSAWVRVPILVAGEQSSTSVEPMISLIKALRECEKKDKIMAASYLMGFPWSDNEDSSVAVYVVTDGDLELAQKEAIKLAKLLWSRRHEFDFLTETYDEKKALDVAFEAVKEGKLPIYLSDSGDNPTAGSTSDCTNFLRLIMNDKRTVKLSKPVIYGGIYDPIAVRACENNVGKEITLTFGGKFDTITSKPITAIGVVKAYIKGWSRMGSVKSDLVLFNSCGVDIVISEAHVGFTDPSMFNDLGVNPSTVEIIVCKLGYLTHKHNMIAKRSILALTKGCTNEELKAIDYKKVRRPIFPLDDDFEYNAFNNLIIKE